jgi:hypothetical protein
MPKYSTETLNMIKVKKTLKFLPKKVILQNICKKYTIRINLKIFLLLF